LRGHFDSAATEEQLCARRLLGRIHAYTQERLRREIQPVTAQDFMRFLLRWQHVEPGAQLAGTRGVLEAIAQLQGFEVPAIEWESSVLAARVEHYRPESLDALCLSGQVSWGRLSLRAPHVEAMRAALLSRATPIAIAARADWPWLLDAARGDARPAEPNQGETAEVLACLRDRGALFLSELASYLGWPDARVREALWDAVARGLIAADGFAALRGLLAPAKHWGRSSTAQSQRRGLRRGVSGSQPSEGRWAPLPGGADRVDPDVLAEAVAEQLLQRWGVVFRDLCIRENLALSWRELAWALRRLEARGSVRGGRFVTGFAGEQYALPEAVELLRAVRRSERKGTRVRISACDPLNLVGTILPGARIPAVRTNFVTYCDGALADDALASDALSDVLAVPSVHRAIAQNRP
jgi:ATP-dependent Lhr-like helicase